MGGKNVKITMINNLLGALAPHLCCHCGEIGRLLCEHCKNDITNDTYGGCATCQECSLLCVCDATNNPYDREWIAASRMGAIKRLIDMYKFERVRDAVKPLVDILDARLPYLPLDTVIVPVPTRRSHIRQRGYDHTLLLARELSARRGLRVASLLEPTSSHTQHFLSRRDRQRLSRGSFRAIVDIPVDTPLLVLDDVITTGSTLREAGLCLRSAGAGILWCAALARQPLDQTPAIC